MRREWSCRSNNVANAYGRKENRFRSELWIIEKGKVKNNTYYFTNTLTNEKALVGNDRMNVCVFVWRLCAYSYAYTYYRLLLFLFVLSFIFWIY